MTYRVLLSQAIEALEAHGIPDSSVDAGLLLEHVTGRTRTALFMDMDAVVPEDMKQNYLEAVARRSTNYPLQYITHEQCFYGYDFYVDERVLIPRFDTEVLEEQLLKVLRPEMKLLDMCTGSGCILLTAMKKTPGLVGTGIDISEAALSVAGINADRLDVHPRLLCSDLFAELSEDETFDVIVSNPPYIRTDVISELMQEVKGHEPGLALDGGADGLIFYRDITKGAVKRLNKGGFLLYEIGYDQGRDVSDILIQHGFADVKVIKDLAGLDRVVMGQLLENEVK